MPTFLSCSILSIGQNLTESLQKNDTGHNTDYFFVEDFVDFARLRRVLYPTSASHLDHVPGRRIHHISDELDQARISGRRPSPCKPCESARYIRVIVGDGSVQSSEVVSRTKRSFSCVVSWQLLGTKRRAVVPA